MKPLIKIRRLAMRLALIQVFVSAFVLGCTPVLAIESTSNFRERIAKADADFNAGNTDAAITEYNQIMALNLAPPLAAEAVMKRGSCYYAKHDLERAIRDFDQALRLDPRYAAAYDNRANALDARGDWDDARKDYDESLRLNPRNPYAYLNRGALLAEHGELTGALSDYAKALELNPHEEHAHIGRVEIYLLQCKREAALKEANAAISIAPGQRSGYDCRASVYWELRRYAEAEADIKKGMRLKSYDSTAGLGPLAWFRATCPDPSFRNGKEALQLAQRRCQSGNFFDYGCLEKLAAAYAELGDFDRATDNETRAIEKAPSRSPYLSDMKERLDLYKKHKPFRDEPRKVPIK